MSGEVHLFQVFNEGSKVGCKVSITSPLIHIRFGILNLQSSSFHTQRSNMRKWNRGALTKTCLRPSSLDGSSSFPLFVLIGDESTLEVFVLPTKLGFAVGMNNFLLINTKQTWQLLLKDFVSTLTISLHKCAQARNVMLCISATGSNTTHNPPNLASFQPEVWASLHFLATLWF